MGKWFVGTPATEDKKRKQREAKEKKQAKKQIRKPHSRMAPPQRSASIPLASGAMAATSDGEDHFMGSDLERVSEGEDLETVIEIYSNVEGDGETWTEDDNKPLADIRPSKRAKARKSPMPSDTPEIEITAYVEVVSAPHTLKAKPTSVTRGPFFFTLDYTYFRFLSSVATCAAGTGKGTPAVTAIDKNQLTWKLSVPANDRKKPLSDEDGFRALLKKVAEVIGRKKDCSVVIMLPPLSKIATNVSSVIFRPSFIIC